MSSRKGNGSKKILSTVRKYLAGMKHLIIVEIGYLKYYVKYDLGIYYI